jgi:hypothetical protein
LEVKVREVVDFDLFMKTKNLRPILAVEVGLVEVEVDLLHVKFQ